MSSWRKRSVFRRRIIPKVCRRLSKSGSRSLKGSRMGFRVDMDSRAIYNPAQVHPRLPEIKKWIISNLVEKKTRFLYEKPYFQPVLWIEDFPYGQVVPCPGKRAFASPKKGVVPLSPMRASAPCCRAIPFPPRLFAARKKEEKGRGNGRMGGVEQ